MIEISLCNKTKKGVLKGALLKEIREFFSEKNEAAKFLRHRFRFIPSRNYVITPAGKFCVGLVPEVLKFVKDNYAEEKIIVTTEVINLLSPSRLWKLNDLFSDQIHELNLKLYDYQKDVVEKCLSVGRGTIVLATAGGKTLITSSLINHLKQTVYSNKDSFRCLFIVPSLSLVHQTIDKFKEYGVKFTYSKWTGNNELNLGTDVVVCNIGILQSKNSDTSFIEDMDLLVIDEVHTLRAGNKINKLIDKIKTPHKFGFTGTLPESKIDKWNIIGKIGPVLYERKSYELRKDNFVSNVQITILEVIYNKQPQTTIDVRDRYRNEIEYIITSNFRNKIINKISSNSNNNLLIMVDFITHGELLYNILSNNIKDKEIFFIQGSVESDVREKIRKKMEYKDNVICIAISKIFSTGIDIKNLHNIIFAGGGKAKIKILQSIGRGLRLHKNKNLLQIIDISDQLYYGIEHAKKRIQFYEQEKIPYQKTTIIEN